jgi:hypothetical protein
MKTTLLSLFTAIVLISIYSCECRITCKQEDYRVMVNMTGFSDTELTPLILKSYIKGSGFAQYVDSFSRGEFSNNTTNAEGQIVNTIGMFYAADKDYTIDLPAIGRSYQLTNLSFDEEICKMCGRKYTIHKLKSYLLNGTNQSTDGDVTVIK